MKIILILFLLFTAVGVSAQDKIDRLSDKIDKIAEHLAENSKQIAETNKQIAITAAKLESLEKSIDKRFDMQFGFIVSIIGLLAVLIGVIFWDRRTALKPFEIKLIELEKEVKDLKEKELRHTEKEAKLEQFIKKLLEKYPGSADLL